MAPENKPITSIESLLDSVVSEAVKEVVQPGSQSYDKNYLTKPVSLLEFAESSKFLGLSNDLFRKVKQILVYIDQPHVREVYLVLGKGSGKSTIVEVCSLYGVYRWSCFRDPYDFFNIMRTAKVACVNVSTSKDQARDVIFEGCLQMVETSPYFKGRNEPLKNLIKFDSGITLYAGHGNAAAWLGYTTFVGGMDEVEFMVDSNNRSQASALYNALRGSLRTRFPRHYKLICISSAKERFSFLMKKVNAVLKIGKPITV